MRLHRKVAYLFVLLCFSTAVAQDSACPTVVRQAMSVVQQDCASTGRNQACYGYVSLNATPREGAANFNFSKEGDLANVVDLDTLRLSALDVANNTWGIALMKLQANLPDSVPGQNVTFLMFGDVQVHNAVNAITLQVTAQGSVNIRSAPSTSAEIAGVLSRNVTATADARIDDGSWLRIQIPDSDAQGWVFASLVTASGDVSALKVVDPTQQETLYTPMQAFSFSTGIGQTNCEQAPQDGILIQTPEGAGQINLRANEVDIQLGSTAFLQAQPNGNMTVSVVEGEGHVTADGKTVAVPAGTQVLIPMDANLHPAGQPGDAQPYDAALVRPLPVALAVLPLQITIALPRIAGATVVTTPEATEAVGGGGSETGSTGYEVVKVMDMGGETLSGTICALDQPFEVTMDTPRIAFTISFTPANTTNGSFEFAYDFPDLGESDSGGGTYVISNPAGDGSRTVTMNGTITTTFNGGGGTIPLHYEMGLSPSSSCSGG